MTHADRLQDQTFRFFFAEHPLPMWIHDRESLSFLAVNAAAVVKYGHSEEEFLRLSLYDIHPAEHHAAIRGAHLNGPPVNSFTGEWIHCWKDGSRRRVRVYSEPISWSARPAHLAALIDVTDERRSAERLREAQERHNHLLQSIRGVVFRFRRTDDGTPRFDSISPWFRALEELDPDDVIRDPSPFLSRIPGEDLASLRAALTHSEQSMSSFTWEGRVRFPDGRAGWRHVEGAPVTLPDGTVAWDGLLTDTTAHREYETALGRGKHLLEESQHLARMGSWEWEPETDQMTWSAEMFRLSGHPEGAFVPDLERLLSRIDAEDRPAVEERIRKLREGPGELTWRMRIVQPGGECLWLRCNGESIRNGGPHLRIVGIEQDITGELEREEEARRLHEKMEQASRFESLSVLAGGIAHDFNNILAGIIGYVDLALTELPPLVPGREYLSLIQQSALRAADLTRQMLAFSGRGHFIIEPVNLSRLVGEMPHLLQTVISRKAALRLDLKEPIPNIEGDKTQLRQIIMNLIINASEAIGERSGVITIRTGMLPVSREYLENTWLDLGLEEGLYSFVEVSDTGQGMSAAVRAQIFDPFFTTKATGHGLGLAATLGIVRGHKGFIKVYSEEGRGTTFKVGFPAIPDKEFEMPQTNGEPTKRHSGRVLIADDEETVRAITSKCLEKLGFETLLARDGREALDLFRADHANITAVLLDLTMPALSGEEVFREIRLIDPAIPVVLMSGFTEEDAVSRFVGRGLAGFLQKPFRFDDLCQKMNEVVGGG